MISASDRLSAGILILRLFIGIRLVYGVMDNVLSWDHMLAFRDFLQLHEFPFPLVSAIVSVYAQLIAGIMILAGFRIRWAAALMIFNFLVAIFMVHSGQSFEAMTTPLAILFINVFLLLSGAGRYAMKMEAE